MKDHFFLHYGWFFQNLGKEGRRTFMHATVFRKPCCYLENRVSGGLPVFDNKIVDSNNLESFFRCIHTWM